MSEQTAVDAPVRPDWARFARDVIEKVARGLSAAGVSPSAGADSQPHGGAFVTLRTLGKLRGCMGTLANDITLAEAVRDAAESAARRDPRFPPLQVVELPDVRIEVSVLTTAWRMTDISQLELGRHGIIIVCGSHRGLFLPQVATDHNLDKNAFLSRCAREKAGLSPDAWRQPGAQVLLFTTERFAEPD